MGQRFSADLGLLAVGPLKNQDQHQRIEKNMVVFSQMCSPLLWLILAAGFQQPGTTSTLVFAKGHALRVYASGRVEKTSFEFEEDGPHRSDIGRGSTDP